MCRAVWVAGVLMSRYPIRPGQLPLSVAAQSILAVISRAAEVLHQDCRQYLRANYTVINRMCVLLQAAGTSYAMQTGHSVAT